MERIHRLVLLLVTFVTCGGAYKTHYLESECVSGGSVQVPLAGSGPDSAVLVRSTLRPSYSMQLKCGVKATAPSSHHVTLSVRLIDFRTNWDTSCQDYVTIRRQNYCRRVYREDEERHYDSSDDPACPECVEFFYSTTGDNATLSGFQGVQFTLTAFHTGSSSGNDTFECANGHVVWAGLTCDGHNNCGDLSDEDSYGSANCGGSGGGGSRGPGILIILGLIILFLMLVMCVATLLCTKNERVRRISTRIRTRTLSFMHRITNNSRSPARVEDQPSWPTAF